MPLPAFPPSGGILSPYLVGVWHEYDGGTSAPAPSRLETWLELVNPTSQELDYRAVFFDDSGSAGGCRKGSIAPNSYELILVKDVPSGTTRAGSIKIVSFHKGLERVQPGLVGYTRLTSFRTRYLFGFLPNGEEEAGRAYFPLFPVPKEALDDGELAILLAACP